MTPVRDAKSALSGRDLPLPKLNVEGSIPFTRFPNKDHERQHEAHCMVRIESVLQKDRQARSF